MYRVKLRITGSRNSLKLYITQIIFPSRDSAHHRQNLRV